MRALDCAHFPQNASWAPSGRATCADPCSSEKCLPGLRICSSPGAWFSLSMVWQEVGLQVDHCGLQTWHGLATASREHNMSPAHQFSLAGVSKIHAQGKLARKSAMVWQVNIQGTCGPHVTQWRSHCLFSPKACNFFCMGAAAFSPNCFLFISMNCPPQGRKFFMCSITPGSQKHTDTHKTNRNRQKHRHTQTHTHRNTQKHTHTHCSARTHTHKDR